MKKTILSLPGERVNLLKVGFSEKQIGNAFVVLNNYKKINNVLMETKTQH